MKYQLNDHERRERVTRRAARRQAIADRTEGLRAWRRDRIAALAKKRADAAAKKAPQSRGVDRVPERIRGLAVHPEWVVEHHNTPRSLRRRGDVTWPADGNQPHINPARDEKSLKAGRLRLELHPGAGESQ